MFHSHGLFMSTKRFALLVRSVALLVTFSFVVPYLTWAFEGGNYPAAQSGPANVRFAGRELTIPGKLGTIVQSFQGSDQTIVCVQDLHCNYEVQTNIAGIIGHLVSNHQLKLLGEEGAFGTVDLGALREFPRERVRTELSNYFVAQGKLTGAEHFTATNPEPVRLEGVDSQDLYEASYAAIRSFLTTESQGFVSDLRDRLESLKPGLYTRELIRFDASVQAYRTGNLDLLHYAQVLQAQAAQLRIDTRGLAVFNRFLHQVPSAADEVSTEALNLDLDRLDMEIRGQLYTSQNQRTLDDLGRRLDLIEKLLNISATPEEVEGVRSHQAEYAVKVFRAFIVQQDPQTDETWDDDISVLDSMTEKALEFYALADRRSVGFVDNLLKKMETSGEKLAVMVNGGFHTPGIAAELKRRNVSFITVQPRLTRQDWVNPYYSLLQGKKLPLEKLLEKKQSIFAVRTWTQSADFQRVISAVEMAWSKIQMAGVDSQAEKAVVPMTPAELTAGKLVLPPKSMLAHMEIQDGNPDVWVLAVPESAWTETAGKLSAQVQVVTLDGLKLAFGPKAVLLRVVEGLQTKIDVWPSIAAQMSKRSNQTKAFVSGLVQALATPAVRQITRGLIVGLGLGAIFGVVAAGGVFSGILALKVAVFANPLWTLGTGLMAAVLISKPLRTAVEARDASADILMSESTTVEDLRGRLDGLKQMIGHAYLINVNLEAINREYLRALLESINDLEKNLRKMPANDFRRRYFDLLELVTQVLHSQAWLSPTHEDSFIKERGVLQGDGYPATYERSNLNPAEVERILGKAISDNSKIMLYWNPERLWDDFFQIAAQEFGPDLVFRLSGGKGATELNGNFEALIAGMAKRDSRTAMLKYSEIRDWRGFAEALVKHTKVKVLAVYADQKVSPTLPWIEWLEKNRVKVFIVSEITNFFDGA
ncbi:MAG: hypothetical protein HGA76_06150, partial [Candidatus Firestonebacteria bacterium]|nr:hypothetical protein [Candidatus Firestonebacteria bacterium]